MFCPTCGTSNVDTARFCQRCGGAINTTPAPYVVPAPPVVPFTPPTHQLMRGVPGPVAMVGRHYLTPGSKSPFGAAILSLFIVGLGQLYNGDFKKSIIMFVGWIVLCAMATVMFFFVWLALAAWSAIDAYNVARGKSPLW